MGTGLALKMRQKWPVVYGEYRKLWQQAADVGDTSQLLGMVQPVRVSETLTVLNLFGQLWYGRGQRHTNYEALKSIAGKLAERQMIVHLPYGMGCGLGGGNWDVVQDIFSDIEGYWCKYG